MKICEKCGSPFKGHRESSRFCSLQCANQTNAIRLRKYVTIKCQECSKEFGGRTNDFRGRKFCSTSCSGKYNMRLKGCRIGTKKSVHVKEFRQRQKQLCIAYKGGKCQICSYNSCVDALEFHHLDPGAKDFSVSGALALQKSFDQMKQELDKCILLCCRCHREEHFKLRNQSSS